MNSRVADQAHVIAGNVLVCETGAMARIRRLEKGSQSVSVHPTEVDCYYQVVVGENGEKYLHLTTFGSDERETKPKSSQTIQLSRAIANELGDVIRATFI